jgi:hypothetical protein
MVFLLLTLTQCLGWKVNLLINWNRTCKIAMSICVYKTLSLQANWQRAGQFSCFEKWRPWKGHEGQNICICKFCRPARAPSVQGRIKTIQSFRTNCQSVRFHQTWLGASLTRLGLTGRSASLWSSHPWDFKLPAPFPWERGGLMTWSGRNFIPKNMLRSVTTRGYVTGNVQNREWFWCTDLIFIV